MNFDALLAASRTLSERLQALDPENVEALRLMTSQDGTGFDAVVELRTAPPISLGTYTLLDEPEDEYDDYDDYDALGAEEDLELWVESLVSMSPLKETLLALRRDAPALKVTLVGSYGETEKALRL